MDCVYMQVEPKQVEDINRRTKRSARTILCSNKGFIEEMIEKVKLYKESKRTTTEKSEPDAK